VTGQDPEELKRRVGRNLSEARKRMQMTQEGLARELKTSIQWVSRVERGEENLTIGSLVKLSDAVGLRVEELLRAESGT